MRNSEVRLIFCLIISFCFIGINFPLCGARSIHRPHDPCMPEIITYWPDSAHHYQLRDSHLEECALFRKFDRKFFFEHILPVGPIPFRTNPAEKIDGDTLAALLEDLIADLRADRVPRTSLKDFDILKARDFNWKSCSGFLVLRFKNYPFVAKLFIQTPSTFVRPFSHGYESCCMFVMGGGITRYLSGFTRIKNLEEIKRLIQQDPYWRDRIDFPRKWFWQPANNRWFILEGHNIGINKNQKIELPSVYGIICDAIDSDGPWWLFNKKNRKIAICLSKLVGNRLDAHIDNFMIEKSTGKIVPVDSEHFPTMVGLTKPLKFKSYSSWYFQLTCKFMRDRYGRSKRKRRAIHFQEPPLIQLY